jgi:hypothetical protein
MTRLRGSWTATAAVTLFLLTACARTDVVGAPSASAPAVSPSASAATADDLVLRVEQIGGLMGTNMRVTRLPVVSVYADGRVITQGPQPAIYPGPALPNILVQQAPPATVDALLAKGRQLGSVGDLGQPHVADASTTRITVAGRRLEVYALRETQPDDPSLTPAQRTARGALTAFVDQLTGLADAPGLPEAQPYQPTAVAAFAEPWVKPTDLPTPPPAQPWPGPVLPGVPLQQDTKGGCVTATGAEASKVLTAAKTANQLTPWTSGSATWTVLFRPLLPDETGCADLQGKR